MIEVAVDVNFVLDAVRFRNTLTEAIERQTDRMRILRAVTVLGNRAGIVLHTGDHVVRNIRRALRSPETSNRGVTREAWSTDDIDDFVRLFRNAVAASGGRSDIGTLTHDQAIGRFAAAGAPDAEDMQMLSLAANSPATVLATSDQALLDMVEFQGVEIWTSDEIQGEVHATLRRLQGR